MNNTNSFNNLRFDRRPWAFPRRLIPIVLAIIAFTLLWSFVPHNALYWLLMPLLAILTWVTTYGWRQALSNLTIFLHRLEQF